MAITNFKKTLWEGSILANFHKLSVAEALTARPTSTTGEKVKFPKVGAGAIRDYSGTIAWDDVADDGVELTFDQKKYFAIKLDDCDAVQTDLPVMSATTEEHAALLAEAYDENFLKVMAAGAKSANVIGSAGTKIEISKENVYDKIVDMGTVLSKNKVPNTNRYVVINAEVLGLLSKDSRFTLQPVVLANGVVEGQTVNGMTIYVSEELPSNKIVAGYKGSVGSAKQIDEVEAMRLENAFADGVRGLCKYGAVVIRPEAICTMHYSIA